MDSPRKPLLQTDVAPFFRWLARQWTYVPFSAGLIALALVLIAATELYYHFFWYFGLAEPEPGKEAMLQAVAPFTPQSWQIGLLLLLLLAEQAIARPAACFRALSHPAVIVTLLLLSLAFMMPAWNLRYILPMASGKVRWAGTELCWTLVLGGLAWRLARQVREKLRAHRPPDTSTDSP